MSAKETAPADLAGISIRVLIVDDDEAHAQAVAQRLKNLPTARDVTVQPEMSTGFVSAL